MTALPYEVEAQQLRILGLHRSRLRPGEIGVDLFAGGGGYSEGYQWAVGMPPAVAVNHDANAIAMHTMNHPEAEHFLEDVLHVDPLVACRGRRVGMLHGSPDCTHFSRAKGAVPKSKKIRGLAWAIVRWAAEVNPRMLSLENVEEFMTWGPLDDHGRPIKSRAGETFRAFVDCLMGGLPAGHPAYEDMHFALVGDPPEPCRKHTRRRRSTCGQCTAFATSDYPRMPLDRYERIVEKCVQGLGYEIEWRTLKAADFGAPTSRKRLYVFGRRDGESIRWPLPTFGPKAHKPYRTAADCIDWTDLGVSIFLSPDEARRFGVKRPLAEATQRRIAEGIRRYVLNSPKPFLVPYHSARRPEETPRVHDVDDPLATQTTENRFAVVAPSLIRTDNTSDGHLRGLGSVEEPVRTITSARGHALIAPTLIQTSYGEREGQAPRVLDLHEPLGTVVAGGQKHGLVESMLTREEDVAAFLVRNNTGMNARDLNEVMPTVCARETMSLGLAHITKFNTGSVGGPVDEPLPTITAGDGSVRPAGAAHGLGIVTAHVVTHNGQSIGAPADAPVPTVTAGGMGHQGVVTAHMLELTPCPEIAGRYHVGAGWDLCVDAIGLSQVQEKVAAEMAEAAELAAAVHVTKFNGTSEAGAPVDEPLHTVTSGGNRGGGHHGMAAVHLAKYYGSDEHGQGADEPLHTIPTVDRFALVAAFLRRFDVIDDDRPYVTVGIRNEQTGDVETFILYDIAMRMLQPRELARAQGFPDSYQLTGTKSQQVARIGNSVCPHVAAAIVRANLDSEEIEEEVAWN